MQPHLISSSASKLQFDWLHSAKTQFQKDGFAIIPAVLSDDETQEAIEALENIIKEAASNRTEWNEHVLWQADIPAKQLADIPHDNMPYAVDQIHIVSDIAAHSQALKEMILDRRCASVARYILDSDVVCHFSNATIRAARVGCSCNWHRDWPNNFCTTHTGCQLRIMICLDGMQNGQGATRIFPGSHTWDREMFDNWRNEQSPAHLTGEALVCPPGSLVILGPTIVHGAESNLSPMPRRNLIAQWGRKSDLICMEAPESITGYSP